MIKKINLTAGICHVMSSTAISPGEWKYGFCSGHLRLLIEMVIEKLGWMGGQCFHVGAFIHREVSSCWWDFVCLFPQQGCLTTPNSPSMNSRSMTLGPSFSLSNISGVSVKSDMKKRRAPPPPSLPGAGPPARDKASEKVGREQPWGAVHLLTGPVNSGSSLCTLQSFMFVA